MQVEEIHEIDSEKNFLSRSSTSKATEKLHFKLFFIQLSMPQMYSFLENIFSTKE